MKKFNDIICISMTTWEGDYMKTIVHMMNHLAKNHRVLFVDYPFTIKDMVTTCFGRANAPVKRMLGIENRLRKLENNGNEIYHLTLPPIFPTNWISNPKIYKYLTSLQAPYIASSIRKSMKSLNLKNPIVINAFNPIVGVSLAGKLDESQLIYYCYDEIRAAQWCGKHGGMMEDKFMEVVDKVIVTSEGLHKTKSKQNPNTILVKNGVDFELFNKAYLPKTHSKRKIVGYVGSIDFRLNFNLLDSLIAEDKYDFHFVGRVLEPDQQLKLEKYSNVTFFGPQQPNDIPKLMEAFDIGIIPFSKNEFTKNIYPLKINEYLAAGIPVVSTDFAPFDDFKNVSVVARSQSEFHFLLDAEIAADNNSKAKERIAVARSNDWSNRANQVESVLSNQYLSA